MMERVKDELGDISHNMFPDISWAIQKPLRISGPCTEDEYSKIENEVLSSKEVQNAISTVHNQTGIIT